MAPKQHQGSAEVRKTQETLTLVNQSAKSPWLVRGISW